MNFIVNESEIGEMQKRPKNFNTHLVIENFDLRRNGKESLWVYGEDEL